MSGSTLIYIFIFSFPLAFSFPFNINLSWTQSRTRIIIRGVHCTLNFNSDIDKHYNSSLNMKYNSNLNANFSSLSVCITLLKAKPFGNLYPEGLCKFLCSFSNLAIPAHHPWCNLTVKKG